MACHFAVKLISTIELALEQPCCFRIR